MALSNPKPHFSLAITACLLFLFFNVHSSESLSFYFPNFWSGLSNITFQGHASSTNGALQLTHTDADGNPRGFSAGHALFSEPLQLRDSKTGNLASFFTNFTFFLRTTSTSPADGFAFFLAPIGFPVKGTGGLLGLFNRTTATNTSENQVVAVEFDTWVNGEWREPPFRHIGIDVNSIESIATTRWEDSDVLGGSIGTARIAYFARTNILNVYVTYPDGGSYLLRHVVDLGRILPEKVIFGFSAATGRSETQYILSWYFSSVNTTLPSDSYGKDIYLRRVE